MDTLDVEGMFWTPETPNNRLFGRLRFDPATGGRLTVHGTFLDSHEAAYEENRPPNPVGRIFCSIRGQPATLEDSVCIRRNMQPSPEPETDFSFVEEYFAPMVLDGLHILDPDLSKFHSVSLRLRHLEQWTNEQLVTTSTVEGSEGYQHQLTAVPRREITAKGRFGSIRLSSSINASFGLIEWGFRQQSTITLDFNEALTPHDIAKYCSALQHLITIAAHKPSTMFDMRLYTVRLIVSPNVHLLNLSPVRLYVAHQSARLPHDGESPIPPNMLFTAEPFGQAAGIARWCEIHDRLEPVIAALMKLWYAPWADVETRFFNLLSSAEMLIRIRKGKQNFDLRPELFGLAQSAGPTFQAFVRDVDAWAASIVQTRINRVVHRGLHEHAPSPDWGRLSNSLYLLVIISLLKECGMSEDQLQLVTQKLSGYAR